MYNQAKKLFKKYYGSSSISNLIKPAVTFSVQLTSLKPKPFFFFASVDECETYVACTQHQSDQKNTPNQNYYRDTKLSWRYKK